MATITGNPYVHPVDVIRSIVWALVEAGHTDMTGEPGAISCRDAGFPCGDSDGNGVRVDCSMRHSLYPGDKVRIIGTGIYDGIHEIEPRDESAFWLLGAVNYTADADGLWDVVKDVCPRE